jgi:renal tumor antigen
MDQYKLEA